MNQRVEGRWFVNSGFDLGFFHVPIWLCWIAAFALPASIIHAELPLWVWLGAVLMIDVGHVWSTIFRTWLDPVARRAQRKLLCLIPLLCLPPLIILAQLSEDLFWRVLAYVAVFHFIRQQIGVTSLYRARFFQAHTPDEDNKRRLAAWDKIAVYVGAGFPVIWWHLNMPRQISWFIPGDFIDLGSLISAANGIPGLIPITTAAFYMVWMGTFVGWLLEHLRFARRTHTPLPLGKLMWVAGTGFNWWLGIVYFDSDLVFTITNVVAHGIPYYGLIALVRYRRYCRDHDAAPTMAIARGGLAGLALVLLLALCEEYLWDFLLYRDHAAFFSSLLTYANHALDSPLTRGIAIALLSMPQVVHYLLDGFIWKFNHHNPTLKAELLPQPEHPDKTH